MAQSLWSELHELFEVDDGSLPEICVNFADRNAVPGGYTLLRRRAARVASKRSMFWSLRQAEERPVDSVPNAAALVISGEAEGFHLVLGCLEARGVEWVSCWDSGSQPSICN
jgi:hypothetical protein